MKNAEVPKIEARQTNFASSFKLSDKDRNNLNGQFFKLKTFREMIQERRNSSRPAPPLTLRSNPVMFQTHYIPGGSMSQRQRLTSDPEEAGQTLRGFRRRFYDGLSERPKKKKTADFRIDSKLMGEDKKLLAFVEKIREKIKDREIKLPLHVRSFFVSEKKRPEYLEQFKEHHRMLSLELKRKEREAKFQRVKHNHEFLLKTRKTQFTVRIEKKLTRKENKMTAEEKEAVSLQNANKAKEPKARSSFFMRTLLQAKTGINQSALKNSVFKMKDLDQKNIAFLMKEKFEQNKQKKLAESNVILPSLLSIKHGILKATNFHKTVIQNFLFKCYLLNRFIDRTESFQNHLQQIKNRFKNAVLRKKLWTSFLSARLQTLSAKIEIKIKDSELAAKVFEKILGCLYLADVHSRALRAVKNYSVDCIMLKTTNSKFDRLHNKMISLIFYYFPPKEPENSFRVFRLFKLKDCANFLRTIESMAINVFQES